MASNNEGQFDQRGRRLGSSSQKDCNLSKKCRQTSRNFKSKNFKTVRKNKTIRERTLYKLTSKTPLEPEVSSTIKNISPEKDLDIEPSHDHNECIADQLGYFSDEGRQLDYDYEDFDKQEKEEDPFILSTNTFTQFLSHLSPNFCLSSFFSSYFGGPEMFSADEIDVQVKSTLFERAQPELLLRSIMSFKVAIFD